MWQAIVLAHRVHWMAKISSHDLHLINDLKNTMLTSTITQRVGPDRYIEP